MVTVLYYFTGTGNSLKVARDIAQGLEAPAPVPMARLAGHDRIPAAGDCVGLVFPVHAWGLPLPVKDFVERLDLAEVNYVFGVATYGGYAAGTIRQLQRLLRVKGAALAAGFTLKMPENYTPLRGPPSESAQAQLFSRAQDRVDAIVATVRDRRTGQVQSGCWLCNLVFSNLIHRISMPRFARMDKRFRVDDRCNSCGLCARVCPVRNIELVDGRPRWRHGCHQCMACLQWCPEEAIQFGRITVKRKRYRHPGVTAQDLIAQSGWTEGETTQ